MSTEVFVMRHGETEANVRQVLMGRGDSPFTEAGRQQPVDVARQLQGCKLARIYSSPMARTQRTASLVVETLDRSIPVESEAALSEIDAGEFTGLSFAEVRERLPATAVLGRFRYPGGESWGDVQDRAVKFVLGLEGVHDGDAVLLITHAGVIASLVAVYMDQPIERYIRTRFGHDYLGRLTLSGGAIVAYQKLAGTVDRWF